MLCLSFFLSQWSWIVCASLKLGTTHHLPYISMALSNISHYLIEDPLWLVFSFLKWG